MPYDLSIIIVNWNGGRLLTRCIETIVSSAPKVTYEIVIVDNASTDDSLAELRANEVAVPMIAREQLRFILNSENRGFGAANNQAFAATDSPYVFLLNRQVNRETQIRPEDRRVWAEDVEYRRLVAGKRVLQSTVRLAHSALAAMALSFTAVANER